MCHYITAILPQTADPHLLGSIFALYKVGLEQISNPHVARQIRPGDRHILTTTGHCDCGTVLGCLNRNTASKETNHDRELKKLHKQGWSEAKIQRWLDEKKRTKEKHSREEAVHANAGTSETVRWVRFITGILRSGQTQQIGLLLHWYRGHIESERISITDRKRVTIDEVTPKLLLEMREDVLYEFCA